tara:strand:- start:17381 stop:17554 length:174 start_codon:yes stop_codon:yes gene_type:complete
MKSISFWMVGILLVAASTELKYQEGITQDDKPLIQPPLFVTTPSSITLAFGLSKAEL